MVYFRDPYRHDDQHQNDAQAKRCERVWWQKTGVMHLHRIVLWSVHYIGCWRDMLLWRLRCNIAVREFWLDGMEMDYEWFSDNIMDASIVKMNRFSTIEASLWKTQLPMAKCDLWGLKCYNLGLLLIRDDGGNLLDI